MSRPRRRPAPAAAVAAAALLPHFKGAVAQYYEGGQPGTQYAAAPVMVPTGMIDCGGHFRVSCAECPESYGSVWCNGECTWSTPFSWPWEEAPVDQGECVKKSTFIEIDFGQPTGPHFLWYSISFWLSSLIVGVFACIYYSKVVKQLPTVSRPFFRHPDRKRGLFACCSDPNTCLHVVFCMPVVAAKNYHVTEVMGFMPGCCLTFMLNFSPLNLVAVILRALLAVKVQERLGHEVSCIKACCVNLFCMPCDIGRESLEVDAEMGAEITCCCNVHLGGHSLWPFGAAPATAAPLSPTAHTMARDRIHMY